MNDNSAPLENKDKNQDKNQDNITNPLSNSITFACGGWLQFYMFGVGRALQKHGLDKNIKFAGCSAGALTAAGLALKGNFDLAIELCKNKFIPRAYSSIFGLFRLGEIASECLDETINLHNYSDLADGELQIAMTRLPMLIADRATIYHSYDDIKNCLLASASAFPFAPLVYHRNNWYVDGGLSDFLPMIDENTVTVSPFYFSDVDIKPSRYVPLWWAFVPPNSPDTIDWLYNLGYEDGMKFIEKKTGISNPNNKLKRNPHPFDTPKKISINRFLGYNLSKVTHPLIGYILDCFLVIMLIFIWKPFALFLIYTELIILLVTQFVRLLIEELKEILPIIILSIGFFANSINIISPVILFTLVLKLIMFGPKGSSAYDFFEYLSCVSSLSLLLRFFSAGLSNEKLRKHDKLEQKSLIYRIFRHII